MLRKNKLLLYKQTVKVNAISCADKNVNQKVAVADENFSGASILII
jgi:hypothetical protein